MNSNHLEDTIAAISTPAMGSGGISIIRISGAKATDIVDRIFEAPRGDCLKNAESHTIHYGHIKHFTGVSEGDSPFVSTNSGKYRHILDEVLVSVMKAPRTFTAEDTVEINCHGGMLVTKKVLEEVLKAGARLADPGEFTKRAFLNGRIDLSEAEAVIDVINAKNEYSLKASVDQLGGRISGIIKGLRDNILDHVAFMEAAMDDPEHISMEGHLQKLGYDMDADIKVIDSLLKTFNGGKLLKEGINTVILGRTNAGKSSLLNLLSGYESAIVTDIEGTTRDTVRENVDLGGIILNLADTAGIRKTDDKVEAIGVEKALEHAESADLILLVIDTTRPLTDEDEKIFETVKNKKRIALLNKSDLKAVTGRDSIKEKTGDIPAIDFSARTGAGLDDLEGEIKKLFSLGEIMVNDAPVIANVRQKDLLSEALESLMLVKEGLDAGVSEDLLAVDMMDAYASLGFILGEEIEDDLADRIFEKFCMGK